MVAPKKQVKKIVEFHNALTDIVSAYIESNKDPKRGYQREIILQVIATLDCFKQSLITQIIDHDRTTGERIDV